MVIGSFTILLLIVIDVVKSNHPKSTATPLTSMNSTNDSGVVIASGKSTNKNYQPESNTDSYTLYT